MTQRRAAGRHSGESGGWVGRESAGACVWKQEKVVLYNLCERMHQMYY